MTEVVCTDVRAIIDGRICDINVRGVYTCSIMWTSDGLTILFADERTVAGLGIEECVDFVFKNFRTPMPFAVQIVALLTGKALCACGGGFAQELHACPRRVNIDGDHITLCTCCKECESICFHNI